jgi:hypothetical protein
LLTQRDDRNIVYVTERSYRLETYFGVALNGISTVSRGMSATDKLGTCVRMRMDTASVL